MPADQPTILATSGGFKSGYRIDVEFGPLIDYAFELSGVQGRKPRMCFVGTAGGDQRFWNAWISEAGAVAGVGVPALILRLVPRPLAWAGLAVAAFSVLSTFTLLTSGFDFTLPIGG